MMKYGLVWDEEFAPKASVEQLNLIEKKLNVTIPHELRVIWTTFGLRCPKRNEVEACYVVGPDPHSGENVVLGLFGGYLAPTYL